MTLGGMGTGWELDGGCVINGSRWVGVMKGSKWRER
ncbi:hypothetical protein A2U01_0074068 [Trifolium medium]|uniref:Uncharacterized protein n=1 Tax=Trifolium medium TaxID=97028 RepID=A0A392SWJ6_9FABA|nr:hypothetical protein [Trifolium medium]